MIGLTILSTVLIIIAFRLIPELKEYTDYVYYKDQVKADRKERAKNQYRWGNGKFSKVKTYADLDREIKQKLALERGN